jgi:arabinose-5-phosphate isomerase
MEAAALPRSRPGSATDFVAAVEADPGATGRVIVSGVGKSGIIGRKIAATLTSTGTPATFLHPVEALHGDLGIVGARRRRDPPLQERRVRGAARSAGILRPHRRTGHRAHGPAGSTLARHADVVLDCSVQEEACPHDLAPTSSTTAALAMGDALAVALLQRRGFGPTTSRGSTPAARSAALLLRVGDVMLTDELPLLAPDATMRECVVLLAEKRGTVARGRRGGRCWASSPPAT